MKAKKLEKFRKIYAIGLIVLAILLGLFVGGCSDNRDLEEPSVEVTVTDAATEEVAEVEEVAEEVEEELEKVNPEDLLPLLPEKKAKAVRKRVVDVAYTATPDDHSAETTAANERALEENAENEAAKEEAEKAQEKAAEEELEIVVLPTEDPEEEKEKEPETVVVGDDGSIESEPTTEEPTPTDEPEDDREVIDLGEIEFGDEPEETIDEPVEEETPVSEPEQEETVVEEPVEETPVEQPVEEPAPECECHKCELHKELSQEQIGICDKCHFCEEHKIVVVPEQPVEETPVSEPEQPVEEQPVEETPVEEPVEEIEVVDATEDTPIEIIVEDNGSSTEEIFVQW